MGFIMHCCSLYSCLTYLTASAPMGTAMVDCKEIKSGNLHLGLTWPLRPMNLPRRSRILLFGAELWVTKVALFWTYKNPLWFHPWAWCQVYSMTITWCLVHCRQGCRSENLLNILAPGGHSENVDFLSIIYSPGDDDNVDDYSYMVHRVYNCE